MSVLLFTLTLWIQCTSEPIHTFPLWGDYPNSLKLPGCWLGSLMATVIAFLSITRTTYTCFTLFSNKVLIIEQCGNSWYMEQTFQERYGVVLYDS